MPSPFPGMDPYIEAQSDWQDFHNTLIAEIRFALGISLPEDYVARVDARMEVVNYDGPTGPSYRPDVLGTREDREGLRREDSDSRAAVATIEPVTVEVAVFDPEEVRHTWLEVRKLPDLELITVVEVLSPTNKRGPGRDAYLLKREELHARKIHLVEIDLLLDGRRPPMRGPLPKAHYLAIVARGPRLPMADVYAWTLRHRLPPIPIPLREPDPDVPIDLQSLVDRIYDLGRYGRTLRYDQPLSETTPIAPEDRTWAEATARPQA